MTGEHEPNTLALLALAHLMLSRRVIDGVAAAGHPLKPAHNAVFGQLGPKGKRLTELARTANLTPQAMAETVDELERLGYVERTPDPSDRRAKLIRLTDLGLATTRLGAETVAAIEKDITATLGADGHLELRALLARLLPE